MIWRVVSTGIILLVFSAFMPLPLTGNGVAVTALWWLVGMPVVNLVITWRGWAHRSWIVGLICLMFAIDLGIQLVLRGFFGSLPQPYAIAEALANTNAAEALNFVQNQAHSLTLALVGGLVFWVIGWVEIQLQNGRRQPQFASDGRWTPRVFASHPKWRLSLRVLLVVFFIALHFNPTMMRGHPLLRLPVLYERYVEARDAISRMSEERQSFGSALRQQLSDADRAASQTALAQAPIKILVIGESSNRDNWSLYGYSRDTTRPLDQLVVQNPKRFAIVRNAFSTHAFTAPSLTDAFVLPSEGKPKGYGIGGPDVFQVAQHLGYAVTWISNQPKGDGWMAALANGADQRIFLNNGNWRDSSAQDTGLLTSISQALDAPSDKATLIVVHVLGQHFHYDQRCPPNQQRYAEVKDAVTESLQVQGRKDWVIEQRNAYDSAVYCGAHFLADLLAMADRAAMSARRPIDLLYFSDHGQEVGHNDDVASHSSRYQSGYKIPVFKWSHRPLKSDNPSEFDQYFQMTQMPSTILGFLEVKPAQFYRQRDDVFAAGFQSVSPTVSEANHLQGH